MELMVGPCHYCQGPRPEVGSGLDRIDNSKGPNAKGYSFDNVLRCCIICNMARGDSLTVKEMEDHVGPAIRKVREEREAKGQTL